MRETVVYTESVRTLSTAVTAAAESRCGQNIILVVGASGAGKTTGTAHVAVKSGALFVTPPPFASPRTLLSSLM